MANLNMDPKQMDQLLDIVSVKLGVSASKLKQELQQGKFDSALNNMKSDEAATFNKIVRSPQMLEKFMSTPQAQALYKKLTEGK
ncbi:MAG: hypothetical protein J6C96_05160 [Oscillospiraceae bacterium]|nr:hypothetical protein [Oscillospiraceae bacterium]